MKAASINVYNMDCMEALEKMPDNAFDLDIVDPPYGDNCNLKGGSSHSGKNGWSGKLSKTDKWNIEPNKEYFKQLFRVSKNQIIWGANHFISKMPFSSSCWLIWDKGQRNFSLADGEMPWTSFKKAIRIFTYARAKALQEGKIHPTQKPVALYKWLLKNYAKEGDKILDTHFGSGSIAIACHDMRFDLEAYELDTEYYKAAMKRLNDHRKQLKMF